MRILAYSQALESCHSLMLDSLTTALGVTIKHVDKYVFSPFYSGANHNLSQLPRSAINGLLHSFTEGANSIVEAIIEECTVQASGEARWYSASLALLY
ncbi:hypothetical protein P691DRAFT_802668 [Macrolepiota fuliginosa MF-IS2]|uniref:Uncharacterized protein n=1 Tax=Macrolepiota fuliginosa MF-IS2 TaxID=1400762 RepID=A0A9P6BUM5_9AGAR|nr:hypothetical protein P691DRAFT_802668 [Macrolepiota fuliginosa MF-IS2]